MIRLANGLPAILGKFLRVAALTFGVSAVPLAAQAAPTLVFDDSSSPGQLKVSMFDDVAQDVIGASLSLSYDDSSLVFATGSFGPAANGWGGSDDFCGGPGLGGCLNILFDDGAGTVTIIISGPPGFLDPPFPDTGLLGGTTDSFFDVFFDIQIAQRVYDVTLSSFGGEGEYRVAQISEPSGLAAILAATGFVFWRNRRRQAARA